MSQVYAGLPKPGHGFYDAAGVHGLAQVRSAFFRRYLGFENVAVPSAGTLAVGGAEVPRPVAVLTDLLASVPGAPAGLVHSGPDEEPWVGCTRLLLERLEQRRVVTVLPSDQHLNPALLTLKGDTGMVLDDARLLPSERAIVARDPVLARKARAGEALTVAEYQQVFGAICDKEDRNFVPHCREGVVEYIPEVVDAFGRQRAELARQLAAGAELPTPWLFPDFKTGLSCLSAPDRRGLRGNALREVLFGAQRGLYFDGDARRHFKLAIVGGTAHEYSVAELVRFLIDLDYTVVLCLAMTGGLGIASKHQAVLDLTERYGAKLFATYDWPLPEFLGPAPAGYAALAREVQRADTEFHEAWLPDYLACLAGAVTSQKRPLFVASSAVAQARGAGGTP